MPTTLANRNGAADSASSGEGEQGGKIKPRLQPSSIKRGQRLTPGSGQDHGSLERAPRQGDSYGYGLGGPGPTLASTSGFLNRSVFLSEIHRRTGRQNGQTPRCGFVPTLPLSQMGGHQEAQRKEMLHQDPQPAPSSNTGFEIRKALHRPLDSHPCSRWPPCLNPLLSQNQNHASWSTDTEKTPYAELWR